MEVDITKLLKKRIYLFTIFFLVIVFCVSFILLHRMGRLNELTVSNARFVHEQSQLQAANPLIVQEIHTAEGEHVTPGMLLVTIQNVFSEEEFTHLQRNVELAQKNVEQIRYGSAHLPQNIPEQQKRLDAARSRMERMNELYVLGAISAMKKNEAIAAYEQEKNALTADSSQNVGQDPEAIQAAEDQLKKAEEALAKARGNTSSIGMFASREGMVSQIFVNQGDRIENGNPILSLDIAENCWIEADIPVDDMNRIYLGQIVQYELDGHSAEGTVEEIAEMETENEDTRSVRISVPPDRIAGNEENIVLHFLP